MRALSTFVLALSVGAASAAVAQEDPLARRPLVDKLAKNIADDLARLCPAAQPADQAAFDSCRQALFKDSEFKRALAPIVLWGRRSATGANLKETHLTQFAPDVLSGLYVPLFMFNGRHTVEFDKNERLYRVVLETAFRNRLPPGQYPYPFWHEANKWNTYQGANSMMLWVDPKSLKVRVGQFTDKGKNAPIIASEPLPNPKFDGKWLWTDANGVTQPVVTLFDGLFSRNNPHLAQLDLAYKDLALRLRDGQCDSCHVPSNPDKMKRLVLLQTPAHAAGEIKRLIKSVREGTMPVDEFGVEKELPPESKKSMLESAQKFDAVLDAVRRWEKQR